MLHALSVPYVAGLILLGAGLVAAGLVFLIQCTGNQLAQCALTLSGYLRPRPDPGMEVVLRTAFTEFDEELTAILGDRLSRGPAS